MLAMGFSHLLSDVSTHITAKPIGSHAEVRVTKELVGDGAGIAVWVVAGPAKANVLASVAVGVSSAIALRVLGGYQMPRKLSYNVSNKFQAGSTSISPGGTAIVGWRVHNE